MASLFFALLFFFFFSSRRRHTRLQGDWSSDVCSSDLRPPCTGPTRRRVQRTPGREVAHGARASTRRERPGCGGSAESSVLPRLISRLPASVSRPVNEVRKENHRENKGPELGGRGPAQAGAVGIECPEA